MGLIDYLSDIENLVLIEMAVFEDNSFKYIKNIPIIYVNITTWKYMPGASWSMYMTKKGDAFYKHIWGDFNRIVLQRYDTFILFVKHFDTVRLVQGL